jgi:hypothetical protein
VRPASKTEEQRAVQGPAHHHLVAVIGHRQCDRLVGVGGAAGGEAADVGSPQACRAVLGLPQHAGAELHRVQSGVHGDVASDHVAHQVSAVLVAGDGERRGRLFLEPQPGVQQRGVVAQAARVSGHEEVSKQAAAP